MDTFNKTNYHFLGIGGIGISAIARMLHLKDKQITGSDSSQSEIVEDLENLGIKVSIGHRAENIKTETEVVIYTVAIKDDNPELVEAKRRGLTILSYPEALGELSRQMYTIAVSGTHGKTTTTAMIGHILIKTKQDPTIVVGSKLKSDGEKNTNFIAGKSKYLVAEACEYKRSFTNLSPQILVILNIEAEHLDYYKDLADIQSAFREIAMKVPEDGFIVTNPWHENIKPILVGIKAKVLDYTEIDIDKEIGVPGDHNILNAKAGITVANALGIDKDEALDALKDFKGTWRRLEYKGENEGNIFFDDYAHHPTEIRASLSALKQKYPDRNLVCVFEAHQQDRTRKFFGEFVEALAIADYTFIAPVFVTREVDDGITTNKKLAEEINKLKPSKPVLDVDELKKELNSLDTSKPLCVVLMGAGNIYKWTDRLLN